jgi:hypothetical protein
MVLARYALASKLQGQLDAYLVLCARLNNLTDKRDRKQLEEELIERLLPNTVAFRNVRVKPHGFEVRRHLCPTSPQTRPDCCRRFRNVLSEPGHEASGGDASGTNCLQGQAYTTVCHLLVARGRLEEAVEVLSRVLAAQPHLAKTRTLLGRCIAELNAEAQARNARARQRKIDAALAPLPRDGCHAAEELADHEGEYTSSLVQGNG